jgi:NADPH-dependent ferric siderophore reductase
MRNYSVQAYRASGPSGGAELDVDFVLHGSGPTAGPASRWAETAAVGESVVIIDEGIGFAPERGVDRVLLVGDETAAPALAGICASLPPRRRDGRRGSAVRGRRSDVRGARGGRRDVAGAGCRGIPAALEALRWAPRPIPVFVATSVPPGGGTRHLVGSGIRRIASASSGYWRRGAATAAAHAASEVH